jgi:Cu+-exporting ATPase
MDAPAACFHCGEPCPDETFSKAEKVFCCQGCLVVHDLLAESGLEQFYDLSRHPGVRVRAASRREQWAYLDDPAVQQSLLDFTDGTVSRVTFQIPAIHCVACVWLLENLFRLNPAIGKSQVNFLRREVALSFAAEKLRLSELVALLSSIGYEPRLTLGELEKRKGEPARKRRWLQVGIAGFAFGNIMLLTIPTYLGMDSLSGPVFKKVFGCLALVLAAPVLVYSASDYWRAALVALRQRVLTLDVPIALGLGALYAQSTWEIVSGRGEGYLDSLAGLVFFLLCGRAFQQKTHDRLAFDLDYRSFFPLSVMRRTAAGEESVAISSLCLGDRLMLRNGELIPADARLVSGPGCIDYSFVTGESEPVAKQAGEYLYAGGKQIGGSIEVEMVKPASQSYLTSLWNHEAFRKDREDNLNTLTNRYSRRFTKLVIAVAAVAAIFWMLSGDPARGIKAFTSVLIVACPCALALAAPFALGTAQRMLSWLQVFLKNALVLERMARVDTIVFDKTGTLTEAQTNKVTWEEARSPNSESRQRAEIGSPRVGSRALEADDSAGELSAREAGWVRSLTRHSMHPHAVRIGQFLHGSFGDSANAAASGDSFAETAGQGIAGSVEGHELRLGSRAWLEKGGVVLPDSNVAASSVSYLSIDGQFRGVFLVANALRSEIQELLGKLRKQYEIALLSGDNERERERFQALFGGRGRLLFEKSPLEKLGFIRRLQDSGKTVMMVGDGLNDAGALQQSDVGVAVVERVGVFSPASDVILEASQVPRLSEILTLARRTAKVIRWSFAISGLYNVAGIGIAAAGVLSPLICAVLMPLSSVSVILFACGATKWAAGRCLSGRYQGPRTAARNSMELDDASAEEGREPAFAL